MKKFLLTLLILGLLGAGGWFGRGYYLPYLLPVSDAEILRIATNTSATDISPYGLNLNNANRVRNIFESLVAFDRNLKIVPSLAVSWGNLDDTNWEFRLRQGVKFHDGSAFTPEDVVRTFTVAKASRNLQIIPSIETIREIMITGPDKIVVVTNEPDPLLLSKLTELLIHKDAKIGTGPYILDEWIKGDHLDLDVFVDYWGKTPAFNKVRYEVMESKAERETAFEKGELDILVGITEDQALQLPKEQLKTSYGLEVNFLMFKLDDEIFQDKDIRASILTLIDPDRIESIGNYFVRSSNQFIAPGVYGFNQNIPTLKYNKEDEVKDLFGNRLQPVTLDYLSSYRTLSEYLSDQLRKAGFSVDAVASEPDALLTKIEKNESQLYLIGWRAADGDAGGFFDAFIHSDGTFNQGRYVNEELDTLIEESRTEMDPKKRLSLLQTINAKIGEDLIGIPLFETSRLFAVKKNIIWEPRLDGQVLAIEVSK